MPKAVSAEFKLPRPLSAFDFSKRLVAWQRQHGRHGLPWQGTDDPYRVWLSEVVLQQTQVVTVITYYERFLQRFPTVFDLAKASTDEVLGLWSGLGYYSRARNLHRCAQQVVTDFGGEFPADSLTLAQLSGIGPSTAAAIASICHRERVAILDGNVQRVLARHEAFEGDLSVAASIRSLRELAQLRLPPSRDMPIYTQAIMDLGATVCTPRQPRCGDCPVASDCRALAQTKVHILPIKTRKTSRKSQSIWMLMVTHPKNGVWLQQRPESGIWSGLYCFPSFDTRDELLAVLPDKTQKLLQEHKPRLHVLTHRDLHLHVCQLRWPQEYAWPGPGHWFNRQACVRLGLPKPVRDWLDSAHGDV